MRVWTIQNQKGGVGKSTLATMLAAYAEQQGETTLLVDLDPQTCCLDWHNARGTNAPMVLAVLPLKLRDVLLDADKAGVDLVIIDTAPHSTADSITAIKSGDLILIPAVSGLFDETGLRDTAKLLDLTGTLQKAIGLANLVPPSTAKEDCGIVAAQLTKYGIKVCPYHLCFRVSYRRCLSKGQGVTEFRPVDEKAVKEVKDLWDYLNAMHPTHRKVSA